MKKIGEDLDWKLLIFMSLSTHLLEWRFPDVTVKKSRGNVDIELIAFMNIKSSLRMEISLEYISLFLRVYEGNLLCSSVKTNPGIWLYLSVCYPGIWLHLLYKVGTRINLLGGVATMLFEELKLPWIKKLISAVIMLTAFAYPIQTIFISLLWCLWFPSQHVHKDNLLEIVIQGKPCFRLHGFNTLF